MICRNCGRDIPSFSKSCKYCGNAVIKNTQKNSYYDKRYTRTSKSNNGAIIFLIGIILIVFILIYIVFYNLLYDGISYNINKIFGFDEKKTEYNTIINDIEIEDKDDYILKQEEISNSITVSEIIRDYFVETNGNEELIEGLYDLAGNDQYYFWIENYSNDRYVKLDYQVEDESGNKIIEEYGVFIRPKDLSLNITDLFPTNYYIQNLKFYVLKEPVDINYDYNYGYDENNYYVTDIAKAGGFTKEEVEKIARQEYIISVATEVYDKVYYFYDQEYIYEEGYTQFDTKNAIYKTNVNYDDRRIELYKIEGGSLEKIGVIDMPFGY